MQVLLVDTVGFIRRLPHNLINAFRSTLEEAARADILLNVLDASDTEAAARQETTLSVLRELGAGDIPVLTVLNKIDRLSSADEVETLVKRFPASLPVSALDGTGLPELCARVETALSGASRRFRFPPDRTDLAAMLHRSGQVLAENYADGYIEMEACVDERTAGRLKEYLSPNE